MLRSGITEIARGMSLMMGLAVSMAIVPTSGTLLEAFSSPKAAGNSVYIYETAQHKVVLIVDSGGTCPSLAEFEGGRKLYEEGPVPLLIRQIGEWAHPGGAGGEKVFKSHCRMNYDVQVLTFEDNQSSSFPPDPIDDRSFNIPMENEKPQNSSPLLGSHSEGLRNL